MPSDKYTFLTPADEVTLSGILKEKFPNIRFYTYQSTPERHYRYFDDIASADVDWVSMIVVPPHWEPVFEEFKPPLPFVDRVLVRVTNKPDEAMFLRRSTFAEEDTVLNGAQLQVGVTCTMNKAQLSFANKVWRLLGKMGTYRLNSRKPDGTWKEHEGKKWFAGKDAVRWALEDERRIFNFGGYFRPISPE